MSSRGILPGMETQDTTPVSPAPPRPERYEMLLDSGLRAELEAAARLDGRSLASWVKDRLRRAARRELGRAGRA